MPRTSMSGFNELRDHLFTDDVRVKRQNIPWFVLSCSIALIGSMLFGIFFGQREAQSAHLAERAATVYEFSRVAAEKDAQIKKLTDLIITTQQKNSRGIEDINSSDIVIKRYLISQAEHLGIRDETVEMLKSQVFEYEVRSQGFREGID